MAAPSPQQIMRCVAAMQRAKSAFAADETLASDEAVLAIALDLDPEITPPDEILRRLIAAIAFAEARADEAKRFKQTMQAREQRYAARAMVLRTELLDVLEALERKRFAGSPFGTFSVVPGAPSALITDEQAIPDEYFKTHRTLDRHKLLDDLKQGVVVDGAVLSNGAPHLRRQGERLPADAEAFEVAA